MYTPTFTRADMVELIGAQLPIDTPDEPRVLIEQIVDDIGVRISAPREAHHREGSERFTLEAIIAEEEHVLQVVDESDNRARLDLHAQDLGDLSADQRRAIHNIAVSPFLIQPLQAPAGAGKTHSLQALRAAAHRARKDVLVLAPTGKAVDEAMSEGAGDHGLTVAKALALIQDRRLNITRSTVVVLDEASMVGTPDLNKLLTSAVAGRAKVVLVGDAYQLSPVNARGGMFEQLCADLPWSQRLGEVWRMADPEERDTSLVLRSAHGNRLRRAVNWYREQGRLHSGDPIAMAADALNAYLTDRAAGTDALLICDTWEIADALNRRLHDRFASDGPTVTVARDQPVSVGDIVMSRCNDAAIPVHPGADSRNQYPSDQVRNGNRWRVVALDPETNRLAAERLTDKARTVFSAGYLKNHVTLGYATTVHSAQGVTADTCYAILGEGASRAMTYVAMTGGRLNNEAFLYQRITNEADHQHTTPMSGDAVHISRRDNKHSAARHLRMILTNDDRPGTVHTEAQRTERHLLPEMVSDLLERHEARRCTRQTLWQDHLRSVETWRAGRERIAATTQRSPGVEIHTDGLEVLIRVHA